MTDGPDMRPGRHRLSRRGAMIAGLALVGDAAAARPLAARMTPARGSLSNPNASPGARALYAYLWSQYGRRTLTGQQEQNFTPAGARQELGYIERVTGRLPAILGLDYIEPTDQARVIFEISS